MFIDERYEPSEREQRIIVCCTAFYQVRWNSSFTQSRQIWRLAKKRRLEKAIELLNKAHGFAVLAYADIEFSQFRSGQIDETADIPAMSRTDNVWSQCVILSITETLAALFGRRYLFKTVDVFYDPKTLKSEHRKAFSEMLCKRLPTIPQKHLGRNVRFRRVEQVSKSATLEEATKFQLGISVSDYLCSQAKHLITECKTGRIEVCNCTDVIRGMIAKFGCSQEVPPPQLKVEQ